MSSKNVLKAVIPAAGLGTRMLPATKAAPKELLPLVDKPVIQYVVEEAVAAGIREIIIITGRGKSAIEDHFDRSFELEENLRSNGKTALLKEIELISGLAEFSYVRQGYAQGLGHAVLCARNLIGDEPFAVLLPDDILDAPVPGLKQMVQTYHEFKGPVIAVQTVPKTDVQRYGVIKAETIRPGLHRVVDLVEKPLAHEAPSNLAILGRYILTPEIFEILEKTPRGKGQEIQLTDALRVLAQQKPMVAKELDAVRYDAGDRLGYLKATVELGLKHADLGKSFQTYLKGLKL